MRDPFYIHESDFRVFLPDVTFKSSQDDEAYDSRKIAGIMSTERRDRQGEIVTAKGLDFAEFLHNGHFNDNHSQDTSAIIGYPTAVRYHRDLGSVESKLSGVDGWTCEGYMIKGTRRADGIWELAQALAGNPKKRLGFSIEGKVTRRSNKTIEAANIRNVAITNCPVNTDCTWDLLAKSFNEEEIAMKSLAAGHGTGVDVSNGSALRGESLDGDVKDLKTTEEEEKKKKREEALKRALGFGDLLKSIDDVLELRPDFTEDAAAVFINHLYKRGGNL